MWVQALPQLCGRSGSRLEPRGWGFVQAACTPVGWSTAAERLLVYLPTSVKVATTRSDKISKPLSDTFMTLTTLPFWQTSCSVWPCWRWLSIWSSSVAMARFRRPSGLTKCMLARLELKSEHAKVLG